MNAIYRVWCDGSFCRRTKIGGWGAILIAPDRHSVELKGVIFACQSSIRAESLAVLYALQKIPDGAQVQIFCDCDAVVNGVQKIISQQEDYALYQENRDIRFGFNADVVDALFCEISRLQSLQIQWVRGHAKNSLNCRADRLANIRGDYISFVDERLNHLGFILKKGDSTRVLKKLLVHHASPDFAPPDALIVQAALSLEVSRRHKKGAFVA